MNSPARFLMLLLISTIFTACREKKADSVPPDAIAADSLISPDKMALVLADVHLVEAALLLDRNEGNEPVEVQRYYQGIYDKHHVTPGMYNLSQEYYRKKPEIYVKIYEKVITVLENRQKYLMPGK